MSPKRVDSQWLLCRRPFKLQRIAQSLPFSTNIWIICTELGFLWFLSVCNLTGSSAVVWQICNMHRIWLPMNTVHVQLHCLFCRRPLKSQYIAQHFGLHESLMCAISMACLPSTNRISIICTCYTFVHPSLERLSIIHSHMEIKENSSSAQTLTQHWGIGTWAFSWHRLHQSQLAEPQQSL